jgi:hypothetical protein
MDNAAYLNSQVACAMIEAMGMQAENEQRKANGLSMAYVEKDFIALIDRYGLGTNSVISLLNSY